MNEPAGDQISDLLNDDLQLDVNNLDASDDVDADEDPAEGRGREGLPPAFRMRHDAHYVDELMSRSPERREMRATLEPAPPPPPPAPSPALALIAERLESLAAHSGIARPQPAATSFIGHSVQVEFARVTRLARAAATLQDREPPLRAELSAREIADTARRTAAPVARLAGMEFDVSIDDPAFMILAEPAMVLQGIAGTVDAVVDLLLSDPRRQLAMDGRHAVARISISLQTVKIRPAIIIDVFCPTLFVSSTHAERFFDNAADDYRMAPGAGVLLAAAAHIVRAHGGRADVKRHSASGATITYVFPQTP